jgi:hypothetical protein
MPGFTDVLAALNSRTQHELRRLVEIRTTMNELSEAFHKYVDLRAELEARQKNLEKIRGTLGKEYAPTSEDPEDPVWDLAAEPADNLRKNVALWEAAEQILRVSGEMRISDLQMMLGILNFMHVTRQGIESAISTHKNIFVTKKKGREKYVSLKSS